MVIPIPMSMPQTYGPPTGYALECKWKVQLTLACQAIYVIGKFTEGDIVGGLLTMLIIGFGYYAVSNDMDMRWLMFWAMFGLMSSIYALADFIRLYFMGAGFLALFSGEPRLMWVSFYVLLGPWCFLAPIYFVYYIYQDLTDGGGRSSASGGYPGERQRLAGGGGSARPQPSFQAFGGSGQKLGAQV
jgi:hypothetical protein